MSVIRRPRKIQIIGSEVEVPKVRKTISRDLVQKIRSQAVADYINREQEFSWIPRGRDWTVEELLELRVDVLLDRQLKDLQDELDLAGK